MGDAIMAFFGAPIDLEDHPRRACLTALMMADKLKELQEGWKKRGVPPFDVGIGINTGPMSVGNMGSSQRFDYTVMGDAVNLGSRLEGLNKMYGTRILISQFTYEALEGRFFCREIDFVAVKGKREPVRIYELISENPIPELIPLVEGFSQALSEYRAGNFEKALALFLKIQKEFPRDRPTYQFVHRCERLLASPPEGEWNGVYVAESK
jgi:adenylate cyclase